MGLRGELFSTKVILPNRTYFFNVKENRMGDLYLNIVESKNRETGGFDRQSVILFADDLQEFLKGFDESLRIMEKEVRQRRRSAKSAVHQAADKTEKNERQGSKSDAKAGPPVRKRKEALQATSRERSSKERPSRERSSGERKRVVVRKSRRD